MTNTLSDLCELIIDCEHKTAPTVSSGFPLIRTPNIGLGRLNIEGSQRVDEDTYRAWTKRAVPTPGDLILAREAPVGNVGPVLTGVQPVLGQRTVLIRSRPDVLDPMYLNYLLSGPQLRGWMDGVSSGATVPHLNMADIRAMQLPPLPPVRTQRKIAAILSAYDDLIENNNRRTKILEEMAQRIYREWFVDFRYPGHENKPLAHSEAGEIPDAWHTGRLIDVVDCVRDGVKPGTGTAGQPYVPIDCISKQSLCLREWRPGSEATSSLVRFREEDILFGAMRPYFHKVAIAPFDGTTRTTCFVLRPAEPVLGAYAALTLFDSRTIDFAASHASGSTIPYVRWDGVLGEMPIVLPPHVVLEASESTVRPLLAWIARAGARNDNLRATRDVLLPQLISGEIDVSDLDVTGLELVA